MDAPRFRDYVLARSRLDEAIVCLREASEAMAEWVPNHDGIDGYWANGPQVGIIGGVMDVLYNVLDTYDVAMLPLGER